MRVATYNTSLYSEEAGGLIRELEGDSSHARKIAAVLQQEVARREKFIDCTHWFSPLQDVVGMLGAAACPPNPAILR